MALVAMQWFPSDGESGRGLCTQPVNDISSAELPLSSALRPDSQTWMSSCEPSVRCVWSQRGGRTLITAALSRHWFPPCPLDHKHACRPPVGRFHWSPHSQLWPVVPFRLGTFKSINSSRRTDTHRWGSCVMSCPDAACHWIMWQKIPPCSFVPNPQTLTWVSLLSLQTALAPKPRLKKLRNLSYGIAVILPFTIPGCPENFEAKSGSIFTPFLLHHPLLGYFHLQYNTLEQIFPWKLFITSETGGGESWAVKS